MIFTSSRTIQTTILVSNFTSAHTNLYSKHAHWLKIVIELNFKEQPCPFWTPVLYYSKYCPLPNANCPLIPLWTDFKNLFSNVLPISICMLTPILPPRIKVEPPFVMVCGNKRLPLIELRGLKRGLTMRIHINLCIFHNNVILNVFIDLTN